MTFKTNHEFCVVAKPVIMEETEMMSSPKLSKKKKKEVRMEGSNEGREGRRNKSVSGKDMGMNKSMVVMLELYKIHGNCHLY